MTRLALKKSGELPSVINTSYAEVQKRAVKKLEEREHLRLELKAREYIHVCHEVIDVLMAGKEDMQLDAGSEPVSVPLDRARVAALKTAMDGSLRLLDRVLPPLKAIEVNDAPEKTLDTMAMSTSELLKLAGHMRELDPVIEGEAEVIPPAPWE